MGDQKFFGPVKFESEQYGIQSFHHLLGTMVRPGIGWTSSSEERRRLTATLEPLMGLANGKDLNPEENAIQILEELEE